MYAVALVLENGVAVKFVFIGPINPDAVSAVFVDYITVFDRVVCCAVQFHNSAFQHRRVFRFWRDLIFVGFHQRYAMLTVLPYFVAADFVLMRCVQIDAVLFVVLNGLVGQNNITGASQDGDAVFKVALNFVAANFNRLAVFLINTVCVIRSDFIVGDDQGRILIRRHAGNQVNAVARVGSDLIFVRLFAANNQSRGLINHQAMTQIVLDDIGINPVLFAAWRSG